MFFLQGVDPNQKQFLGGGFIPIRGNDPIRLICLFKRVVQLPTTVDG